MFTTKATVVFAITLVMGVAIAATAGAQFLDCTTASTAAPAGVTPVLFNLPNGQGSTFTQAGSTGGVVDATITLTLRTEDCQPIANFSRNDMWLEKEVVTGAGNFTACMGGTVADANTNAAGVTTWVAPLRAGGWSTSRTLVVVNGMALTTNTGLILRHNSADLNGDRVANLSDIALFAADYVSGLNPLRSDLQYDGIVNLGDIPRLASGIGADCW